MKARFWSGSLGRLANFFPAWPKGREPLPFAEPISAMPAAALTMPSADPAAAPEPLTSGAVLDAPAEAPETLPPIAPSQALPEAQPIHHQAPFLGRLPVARLSAELHWQKLSRPLQKLLGRSAKKLRGRSMLECIHPDDRPVVERRFRNLSKVAFEARFRLLPPTKRRSAMIRTAKAELAAPIHVQMTAAPWRDSLGAIVSWRCLFIDLTRQVRSEEARQNRAAEVAQAQEKWRRVQRQLDRLKESYFDLYHNAPVMYFSLDAEGKFVTFNDTLLRALGFTRDELLGHKYADILTKTTNTPVSFELPSDREEEWETQWRRRNGTVMDIWLRTVAVFDEQGKFVRWRSSALDFTERNRLANELRAHTQELENANASLRHINTELEAFTHVVSHDLKEPLRTLQAYSRLLADDFSSQLSPDAFQYVHHLVQASQRLGRLIDDLLVLSQAGKVSHKPKAFNLIEVVATVRRDLVNLLQRKEAIVLTEGALPIVVADPQRITQLLTNLVANGLKYNKNPQPKVVISQVWRGGDDRQAIICVRDNGIGIDPKYHQQIFGMFRRVNPEGEYEGTGVGLAICKRIVEVHGGRIWVESEPGNGAAFYFTLPILQEPAVARNGHTPRAAQTPPVRPSVPAPRGKHVLLVEDTQEMGSLIQKLGARSGIKITWFKTAEEAWDWLQNERPDFLLLDINLGPGMDGLALCRRIRTDLKSDAPIAIFSHQQRPQDSTEYINIGADHFLSKDLLAQPAVWQRKLAELLAAAHEPAPVA